MTVFFSIYFDDEICYQVQLLSYFHWWHEKYLYEFFSTESIYYFSRKKKFRYHTHDIRLPIIWLPWVFYKLQKMKVFNKFNVNVGKNNWMFLFNYCNCNIIFIHQLIMWYFYLLLLMVLFLSLFYMVPVSNYVYFFLLLFALNLDFVSENL